MTRTDYRLFAALVLSLSLHLLPFLPSRISLPEKQSPTVPLNAELRMPAPVETTTPPLMLPEQPKPSGTTKPPPENKALAKGPRTWTQAVRDHIKKLDAAGQFYPAEAIARGLQGDVEVLLIIDEAGKVSAARVEQGSGHPILDEAALRAVRSLRSLPADAPRQVVLPVRFRLK